MGTYGFSAACWPLLRMLDAAEREPLLPAVLSALASAAADALGLGSASRPLNLARASEGAA
jgi:hypothetical protein